MGKRMSLRGRLILSVSGLVFLLLFAAGGVGVSISANTLAKERVRQGGVNLTLSAESIAARLEQEVHAPVLAAAEALEEAMAQGVSPDLLVEEGMPPKGLPTEHLQSYTLLLSPDRAYDGVWSEGTEPMLQKFAKEAGMGEAFYLNDEEKVFVVLTPLNVNGEAAGFLRAAYDSAPYLTPQRNPFQDGALLALSNTGMVLEQTGREIPKGVEPGSRFFLPDSSGGKRFTQVFDVPERVYEDLDGTRYQVLSVSMKIWDGELVWAMRQSLLAEPFSGFLWVVPVGAALGGLLTALLMAWRLGTILEPVERMARSAGDMAKGRYSLKVDYKGGSADEFGALCENMQAACESTKAFVDDISHTLGRMALGDFTVKTEEGGTGDFSAAHKAVNQISNALHDVFLQINETAKWGLAASYRVTGIAGHLATGNEAQTNAANELSKAATLLRHETTLNAQNAAKAQELSLGSNADLRETLYRMRQTLDSLRMLRKLSGEVMDYLETIRDASRQLSLLCFKAAAEAARMEPEDALAFSFVTDELQALAKRCEDASGSAGDILSRSRDGLECTTEYATAASDSVRSAAKKNGQANEFAGRVTSASQIQSQAAACVRKESSIIAAMAQVNTQVAEQCSAAGETLSKQARTLSGMAASFYTKGGGQGDKSAPIIFDADSGDFSVTDENER